MEQPRSTIAIRSSLSEQVRNRILSKIATGEFAPGHRIVEARMVAELHVSSIPVREAIRELVAKRVLEYIVHKGARVREVSMAETADALQVKAVLEALAVRLAGKRLVERTTQLRGYLGPIRASLIDRDYVRFQDENQSFHRGIVEASANPILLTLWDSLAFEVRTRFLMDHLGMVDPYELAKEHEDVLCAVEEGDTERVASLLLNHSNHLVENLRKRMAEDPAQGDRPPA